MPLVCRGVSVSYPGVEGATLRDVSLSVERGRVLGIAGCSGSGKTTLLRCLAGTLVLGEGAVERDGLVVLVQQLPEAQLFAATVGEEVGFGPRNQGLSESEASERVAWALGLLGFDAPAMLGRNPLCCSGGEKRRLAIAGMVAMRPAYLLLDEPTAGLDPAQASRLAGVVRELAAGGMGVAVVSHDMELLASCADDAALLAGGEVVLRGAGREVLGDAAALRSAGLEPAATVDLADRLRSRGVPLPAGILTPEGLAAALAGAKRVAGADAPGVADAPGAAASAGLADGPAQIKRAAGEKPFFPREAAR